MPRKIFIKFTLCAALLALCFNASAVTDAEMDQARAIAAKFYVRYINNGAGYLDNWTPKSMDELEKKLTNNTDRENFKAFKKVPVATDYASWDKAKLASYWSESFFKENASSLDEKAAGNGMCRKQIKQTVEKMEVAAPAEPAAEAAPAPEAPEGSAAVEDSIASELARADAEIQEAQDIVEQEAARPAGGESSGTWVYVMVLAILVGVVIFLVVFASRTMKGQQKPRREQPDEEEEDVVSESEEYAPAPAVIAATPSVADDSRMREKYAQALASKAEEIRSLNRQLADMEQLASRLKEENRSLTLEVEKLRKYVATSQPASIAPATQAPVRESIRRNEGSQPKEVYLGRVNSKGLFVRADRHAVDGQSIFKLTTVNGQTGTFALIQNPLIEEQVLDDPGKWLANGCFAKDIFDTEGRMGVRTEIPGTAAFRDGAWRVEKKAKIRYI